MKEQMQLLSLMQLIKEWQETIVWNILTLSPENPTMHSLSIDKNHWQKAYLTSLAYGQHHKDDRPCGQHYILLFSVNLKKYGFVRSNRTKVSEEVKHILRVHHSSRLCVASFFTGSEKHETLKKYIHLKFMVHFYRAQDQIKPVATCHFRRYIEFKNTYRENGTVSVKKPIRTKELWLLFIYTIAGINKEWLVPVWSGLWVFLWILRGHYWKMDNDLDRHWDWSVLLWPLIFNMIWLIFNIIWIYVLAGC